MASAKNENLSFRTRPIRSDKVSVVPSGEGTKGCVKRRNTPAKGQFPLWEGPLVPMKRSSCKDAESQSPNCPLAKAPGSARFPPVQARLGRVAPQGDFTAVLLFGAKWFLSPGSYLLALLFSSKHCSAARMSRAHPVASAKNGNLSFRTRPVRGDKVLPVPSREGIKGCVKKPN